MADSEERKIGLVEAVTLGVGTMIGAGIFTLSGVGAQVAGPAVAVSFVLAGIIALLTALNYCELSSTYPESGGGYVYAKKGFGKFTGFVTGWLLWFGYITACFVYSYGFGKYFSTIVGLPVWASSILVIFSVALINILGTDIMSRFQNLLVFSIILGLGVFVLGSAGSVDPSMWNNFAPQGWNNVAKASGMLFITFLGFEIVSSIAGDVKKPSKTLPRSIIISVFLVMILYVVVSFVITGIIPYNQLGFKGPVEVAYETLGPYGVSFLTIVALMATISSLNASLLAGSRVSLEMSKDSFFPPQFSRISRFGTPIVTIIVSSLMVVSFTFTDMVEIISYAASINFVLAFILVNLSTILLRYEYPDKERPFEVPGYPVTQFIATLLCVAMLVNMDFTAWTISIVWLFFGVGFFFLWYEIEMDMKIDDIYFRKFNEYFNRNNDD
ncbi:MAG: APC family permease [Candidatus Aenigmatarchaeota archaeon]